MAYRISLKASSQPHYLMEYVCICMDMAYIQHILVKPLRKIMVLYYREARKLTFQDLTFQDCQNLCINSLSLFHYEDTVSEFFVVVADFT